MFKKTGHNTWMLLIIFHRMRPVIKKAFLESCLWVHRSSEVIKKEGSLADRTNLKVLIQDTLFAQIFANNIRKKILFRVCLSGAGPIFTSWQEIGSLSFFHLCLPHLQSCPTDWMCCLSQGTNCILEFLVLKGDGPTQKDRMIERSAKTKDRISDLSTKL